MTNSENQNPCLVAAWLLSQCAGGNWLMPQLPSASTHYGTPGFGNIAPSLCSCSWATYNTVQACAYCQGVSFNTAILTWNAYNPNCTANFISAPQPWSSNVVIPEDTAIPFWAETNPTVWEDSTFDPDAAQRLALQNKPDLTEGSKNNKKSTPTGAIVGGVVGGIAIIAAIGLGVFFWRRRQYKRMSLGSSARVPFRPMHGHSPSDYSTQQFSDFSSSPSPGLPMSVAGTNPGRPPFHQHNSSLQSIQNQSYSSHSPDFGMLPPGAATPVMGVAMGVVPLNSPPSSYNNRGVPPSATGHAHTLSNQSNMSSNPSTHDRSMSYSSDTPEGAIMPFILPPAEDAQQDTSMTSANVGATSTPVRKTERKNPPAYSPVSSPEEQMFNSSMARVSSFSQASIETHATASQALSGTTLLQDSREPTMINSSVTEEPEEGEQEEDHHGYPADRKV